MRLFECNINVRAFFVFAFFSFDVGFLKIILQRGITCRYKQQIQGLSSSQRFVRCCVYRPGVRGIYNNEPT